MRTAIFLPGLLLTIAITGFALPAPADENPQPILINSYQSGDHFYLDPKSFKVTRDGKISYNVNSDHGANGNSPPNGSTTNEVDCSTGNYRMVGAAPSGNIHPAKDSALYKALKEACAKHRQDLKTDW
jgi:hypothetical protein